MNRSYLAMRGLAITLVVFNHSISLGSAQALTWGYTLPTGMLYYLAMGMGEIGIFAVPIFLFISGCFFAYAMRGQPHNISKKFLFSNISHLLWPYFIWSVIFYIVIYIDRNESFTFWEYLKNIIVGYPYHFIPIILFWYIFSPFIARAGKRISILILCITGIYQLLLQNFITPGLLGFTFPAGMNWLQIPVLHTQLAYWGIYFPLGMFLSLYGADLTNVLRKFRWLLIAVSGLLFVAALLDSFSVINFPLAPVICPFPLVFVLPTVKRENLPLPNFLEGIGKKSFGLYLMNLIVIDLILNLFHIVIPVIFEFQIGLYLVVFIIGIWIPMFIMINLMRVVDRKIFTFVFG